MAPVSKDLIPALNHSLELSLPGSISLEELKGKLTLHINYLINHDFEKLVSLLYRIDVSEPRLRKLLNQTEGKGAAALITDLIIERQLEKIKSRQQFRQQDNDIDENEKW